MRKIKRMSHRHRQLNLTLTNHHLQAQVVGINSQTWHPVCLHHLCNHQAYPLLCCQCSQMSKRWQSPKQVQLWRVTNNKITIRLPSPQMIPLSLVINSTSAMVSTDRDMCRAQLTMVLDQLSRVLTPPWSRLQLNREERSLTNMLPRFHQPPDKHPSETQWPSAVKTMESLMSESVSQPREMEAEVRLQKTDKHDNVTIYILNSAFSNK